MDTDCMTEGVNRSMPENENYLEDAKMAELLSIELRVASVCVCVFVAICALHRRFA